MLSACATYRPSRIRTGDMAETGWTATRYFPVDQAAIEAAWMQGEASWYGSYHQGRRTATGERFNMYRFTAAHKSLPFNTVVRVTREDTGASVLVRINDRGPYSEGRIIDLSFAAAHALRSVSEGVVDVRLEVVEWGDGAVYEDR
jgi:rare lipoprotein A